MKKLFAIFMMTVLLLSVAACGDRYGDDTPVDTSKSQLYVGTYDGGLKTAWITKAAARFEALYADTEFEPGKKGVEIIITPNKNYGGTTFRSDILSSREEVFFIELSDYYELMTYDQTNRLLDITDAVTTPLTEYGESKSIEDKMYASDVSFFKTSDGKYYGLPFYEATYGIFYDVELFEQSVQHPRVKLQIPAPTARTASPAPLTTICLRHMPIFISCATEWLPTVWCL